MTASNLTEKTGLFHLAQRFHFSFNQRTEQVSHYCDKNYSEQRKKRTNDCIIIIATVLATVLQNFFLRQIE